MIRPGSPPTSLERLVLKRILSGEDPWNGFAGIGSRDVSQAIGRLQRRGFLDGMAPTMAAKRLVST